MPGGERVGQHLLGRREVLRELPRRSTRSGPLSSTTQASGPAIVSWVPLGNIGITCTPYFASGNSDRFHGPVMNMPILLALKSWDAFSLSGAG